MKLKHGFLYILIKFIINNLRHLSLVEWFKFIGYALNRDKNNNDEKIRNGRVAVDVL